MKKRAFNLMLAIVMIIAMAMAFGACDRGGTGTAAPARAAAGGDGILVGFSIKNLNNAYMIAMEATVRELSKEKGFELIVINAEANAAKQQADVEDLIARGVDIMLVDSHDPMAIIAISRSVADAGIQSDFESIQRKIQRPY